MHKNIAEQKKDIQNKENLIREKNESLKETEEQYELRLRDLTE